MSVPTFAFKDDARNARAAFIAQTQGTDPYVPGRRSRPLLAEILSWGIDAPAFVSAVRNEGVALLTNLPLDPELPLSPPDGRRSPDKRTYVSEGLLNAVSFILNMHPVAFHNEKEGDLIHQLVPIPGREHSISNQGAFEFDFHTEGTHFPYPPNVLALVCVRNEEAGGTGFVSLDRVMDGAPPEIVAELRQDKFTLPISESYGMPGARYRIPIIIGPDHDPIYRVDFTDVQATDDASAVALAWLHAKVRSCADAIALQPGQLVVLNNHRSLHSRVGFKPDYSQGKQRWLQRQYMTANPLAGQRADERYPHVWLGS